METVRYSKWSVDKDFYGLFDLICVSKYNVRFVQVKTNAIPSKAWIAECERFECPIWAVKEFCVYKDGYGGNAPFKQKEVRCTVS